MSDFDYKANYDAARDRAKELIESKKTFIGRESLEYIFPELKPNLPDKIYIQENDPSMRYGVNQDADINGMHEYIRKEALIEWAKEKQKDAGPFTTACYQVFVDKLNSM